MTEIKIDKGIPLPQSRSGGGVSKYPFEEMEVGDSFFMAGKKRTQADNACSHWRKKNKWRFAVEYRTEEGVEGSRVWRTE